MSVLGRASPQKGLPISTSLRFLPIIFQSMFLFPTQLFFIQHIYWLNKYFLNTHLTSGTALSSCMPAKEEIVSICGYSICQKDSLCSYRHRPSRWEWQSHWYFVGKHRHWRRVQIPPALQSPSGQQTPVQMERTIYRCNGNERSDHTLSFKLHSKRHRANHTLLLKTQLETLAKWHWDRFLCDLGTFTVTGLIV